MFKVIRVAIRLLTGFPGAASLSLEDSEVLRVRGSSSASFVDS